MKRELNPCLPLGPRVKALRTCVDELVSLLVEEEAESCRLARDNQRLRAENAALADELHAARELRDAAEEAVGELQAMNERAQGVTS